MKTKKYTHAEFIKMLDGKGIKVDKITRKMVHVIEGDRKYWWPKGIMPIHINTSVMITLFDYISSMNHEGTYHTVPMLEAVKMDRGKIPVIKEIRQQTGMALKDVVNFVNVNFFNYPIPREG